jgi:hypothetical protein
MKRLALSILFLVLAVPVFAQPEWAGSAVLTQSIDNVLSAAVEIPPTVHELAIVIPTITSSTVFLKISHDGTTYQNLYATNNRTNQILWSTAAATGGVTVLVQGNIGFWRYVKVGCGTPQAADRTFTLVGK